MANKKLIWRLSDASTVASTATLEFPGGGGITPTVTARVLGYSWATGSTMASSGYFFLKVDGVEIKDAVGARFSGGVSNSQDGVGIEARKSLSVGFSQNSPDGGLQTFLVWGDWI